MTRLRLFLLVAMWGAAVGCGDDDAEDTDASEEPTTGEEVCGDGTRDEGEQCDDGNTSSGDGCSSRCQREDGPDAAKADAGGAKPDAGAMDAGARDSGGDDDDDDDDAGRGDAGGRIDAMVNEPKPDASPDDEPSDAGGDAGGSMVGLDSGSEPMTADLCTGEPADDCERCGCTECATEMTACREVQGVAAEGPGAGTEKSDLCQAVVRCGQENGCRGEACFCGLGADGAVDLVGCLTVGPMGPCKDQIFAAAETDDPAMVASRRTDQNFALIFANDVSACTTMACAEACGQ